MKVALITGIYGQDGAYLSELLLKKGYKVYGLARRSSTSGTWRLERLGILKDVEVLDCELTEFHQFFGIISKIKPDEVYNLAAQSFVKYSFENPIYTGMVDGMAVTYMLEAIRQINPKIKFYQASTSEMFGKVQAIPQIEDTPFYPRSPYGVAKLYAHWIVKNYRESYGMFLCSGILFNHESPLRGVEFVTRKITHAIASILAGKQEHIELGNLDAKRDWGFAGDYVEGMYLMLQAKEADDFVLATNKTYSIREFLIETFKNVEIELEFKGSEEKEIAVDKKTGKTLVKINPKFYRPAEVELLIGNPEKAAKILGWNPKMQMPELAKLMVQEDIKYL